MRVVVDWVSAGEVSEFVCCQGRVYNYCSAQLVSTEGVDFETTPSLTVTIIAMDDNFHRLQEEFRVEVLDQNDPPTVRLTSRCTVWGSAPRHPIHEDIVVRTYGDINV